MAEVLLNILECLSSRVDVKRGVARFCGRLGVGLLPLFTLCSVMGFSQSFPVQVIPQATPPPPIYLSDYADASTLNGPLRVQLILNDFEVANREIRLRAYFEGGNISFRSNDVVVGADQLFLEGGIPLVLTHTELAPYFRLENLSGISPTVYGQAIPEGAYQFCFEVYDVLTGNRLSQKSCVTTVVFQNEPPFLISPRNGTNVEEFNPQNIVFQWTPRHINVTNVDYELSIVEIWDTQVDPQQAFLSSVPVFQTTTSATTYVYGPADPLLLSGKNYAWRIQAKAKQGIEEIGLFENQGYSEIYSFSYSGGCDLPLGIEHEVKGSTNANIFWDDFSTDVPEYAIRYRKAGPSGSPSGGGNGSSPGGGDRAENEWFLNRTTSNQTTIWDLTAGTTYEYQVSKTCTITESDWSPVERFTTFIADDEASVYECGITPDFSLSNRNPLPSIAPGETFVAGDFPIRILEVSGSNGRFTGKGYATIPYLNSIRVGVEFTNVLLNTDKQLAEGTVKTVYDPSLGNILDVDDAIDTVQEIINSLSDLLAGIKGVNNSFENYTGTEEEIEEIDNEIDSFGSEIDNILNDPTIPESTKTRVDNLYQTGGQNFDSYAEEPGGPNADGYFEASGGSFGELEKEVEDIKENQDALNKLAQAMLSLDGQAFLKCGSCGGDSGSTTPIDGEGSFYINSLENLGSYLRCIVGERTNDENNPVELARSSYSGYSEDTETTELQEKLAAFINFKDEFLVVAQTPLNLVECQVDLTFLEEHCSGGSEVSEAEIAVVTEELNGCLDSNISTTDVATALRLLNGHIRANQNVEFERSGQIYRLDAAGNPELVADALSDEAINSGDFTDSGIDLKIRVRFNEDGVLQYSALGIKNSIENQDGKQFDVRELSDRIRTHSNRLFLDYSVTDITKTLGASNFRFDSDDYPDGKKLEINKDVSFFKYFSELGGITTTFIQTTKIEEDVYNDTPKTGQVLRGPPVLTGTVEGAAKEVTEITSMVIMVYDVATDAKIRQETVNGFIAIKDKVIDNPSSLYPLVKEVVVEEITGLTPDELAALDVDTGEGQHNTSKTSIRTVASILAGGKFLSELPDITLSLALKLARAKAAEKFKSFDDVSGSMSKKLDELGDLKNTFLDDFADASDDVIEQIARNPDLVDGWKLLDEAEVDPSVRKKIDALTDPDAAIDAIQQSPKAKPTWPEIQALFKRGNDFNAKGRLEYEYNEINLSDGKRLDSYIPGEEIVSRKATTLSQIQTSTFEGYLKELTTKYQKGKTIRSNKYQDAPGAIDGQQLSGDYYLEIPTSNKSFFESSQILQDLARQYDVKIKYLDE